ncbi:MAG: hypothetical protein EHM70_17655, partial [Chloroflexota bacterium]
MIDNLTPRERLNLTLNHQEPDRVPLMLGGSANHLAEDRYILLRDHFGLQDVPRRVSVGMYTTPDYNPLLDKLGTDVRYIHMRAPSSFVANPLTGEFKQFTDEWGLKHSKMSGFLVIDGAPLAGDLTVEKIEKYPWPDPYDPARMEGVRQEVERLYNETHYAIAAHRPVYGNCWEFSRLMLGMENALMMTALDPNLFDALLGKLSEVLDGFYDAFLEVVGPYVQIVEMAEDLGTNSGPMISPNFYRKVIKPHHKKTIELIKRKAPNAKVLLHCDGAVRKFIPDLIDAGFDILNPIEAHLPGMDPVGLKADFGRELTFQGGVDVKDVLNKGTVEDVRRAVRQRIEQFGPGGGYIL